MLDYWILLSFCVYSFISGVYFFVTDKRDVIPAGLNGFVVFIFLMLSWLIFSTFNPTWTPSAILFTIIWVSNWASSIHKIMVGYIITKDDYFKSSLISLSYIILLLIYKFY